MSDFCTIKDIENAIPEENLLQPNELITIRETAQNWIKGKLGAKYKVEEFDSDVAIVKQLTIDYARAHILTYKYVNNQFNDPADFFTSVNTQIDDLNADSGNIFKSISSANITFTNSQYQINDIKPRNIRITATDSNTKYFENINYYVDYYMHTILKRDDNMPDTVSLTYEISLRR